MDMQLQTRVRSISIVMPYYNEELNIERSLREALNYLRSRFDDFEIIAVDDCSQDRTLEIARAVQVEDSRVRIVALEQNSKFAGALKKGFAAAQKQYVFYTDGDCPIDFNDIDRAIAALDRHDVVVGYRRTRGAEGFSRYVLTHCYRSLLAVLLGLRFRDVNFSFKLFTKEALGSIAIESTGSFIDAEILYKLQRAGYRIGQIPVNYHSRVKGVSTLASPAIVLRIFREVFRFRLANPKLSRQVLAKGPAVEQPHPVDRQ